MLVNKKFISYSQSVRLHAQLSRAAVIAQLDLLIWQLSLTQYTSAKEESICLTPLW